MLIAYFQFSRYQKLLKRDGVKQPGFSDVLNRVLREFGVRHGGSPHEFSYRVGEATARHSRRRQT